MPALRFDMLYPQKEGFTLQNIRGLEIWAYTLPLQPGENSFKAPMSRRTDNNYVNATRMLQLTNLNPSQRARELNMRPHLVIRGGLNNVQGTWVPLPRARELATKYGIADLIGPILFDPNSPPKTFTDERDLRTPPPSRSAAKAAAARKNARLSAPAHSSNVGSSSGGVGGLAANAARAGRASVPASMALAAAVAASSSNGGAGGPTGSNSTRLGGSLAGGSSSGGNNAASSSSGGGALKRKFGSDDTAADGRHQIEIASWTSRSHGSDSSAPSNWHARPGTLGNALSGIGGGSTNNSVTTSTSASGSSSRGILTSDGKSPIASSDPKHHGLDVAERLRPRSPTLAELRSMMHTNKRRATSPDLRSAASHNSARLSLRGGSGSDGDLANASSSSAPGASAPEGSSPSSPSSAPASILATGKLNGASNIDRGGDASGSASQEVPAALSVHDPATWDSKFVVAFGRSRGWDEQRVLSKLRDGDMDGNLLLSLDFNDQSVFVLNRCGITVPGDQMRVIQAAGFLREIYPTGPEHRLFGQLQ
ncbi:hypothetical protein V8E36_007036 [Tilletia maclaganii]